MIKKTFLKLSSPVQYIKGVGPKRAMYLKRLGIECIRDLLLTVPRRYLDYSTLIQIKDLKINDEITTLGVVRHAFVQKTRSRGGVVNVTIADESGSLVLKWFNRPDLRNRFKVGDFIVASGKVSEYFGHQLINPLFELVEENGFSSRTSGSIVAVYPLTEGLSLWDIRRIVKTALDECRDEMEETIPECFLRKHKLPAINQVVRDLHFPVRIEDAVAARRRLVYEEFFFFELALARRKAKIKDEIGIVMKDHQGLTRKLLSVLPYELTAKQRQVIEQIKVDMEKSRPMNRLLQGDVGAGKTIIALYAMLIAVENGYQAVIMAPTEILAEQHFLRHAEMLKQIGVPMVLLTGSQKPALREQVVGMIRSGEAKLIIGTHALIEEGVNFDRLGLVIVDEQHRFGVMQRAVLVNKGTNPDFLVLSATPIPRTLALTLYGDLDVSTLDEKPPNRGMVSTKCVGEKEKAMTFRFIQAQIAEGRQMFVICPIIEQSDKVDLKSVEDVHEEIRQVFPTSTVAVIHGRLRTEERLAIMNDFRRGAINILVATTIIEVGIDIPNATVMIIEHPERFGLAQLHQLRGRIGRGLKESYCFLFLSRFVPAETYDRITFFARTNDGFELARKDMKLRGPGEILGKKQHGLPDIKIGDLEEDQELLFLARDDAFELIGDDPEIIRTEHLGLKRNLMRIAEREKLLRIG